MMDGWVDGGMENPFFVVQLLQASSCSLLVLRLDLTSFSCVFQPLLAILFFKLL
jgi:hypothetical protein